MAAFPTFVAIKIDVKRSPVFDTTVQTCKSGMEVRSSWQSTPRYRYEFDIDRLSESDPAQGNELATLLNFFEARKGRYDTFTFTDPVTSSSVTVRFDTDEIQVERVVNGRWKVSGVKLISVK